MPVVHLFILESIGTQELILVGLVALIVFGPRKLPQMARKFGGILTEFRKVSNDFRQTWEREASMVQESFRIDSDDKPRLPESPVPREKESSEGIAAEALQDMPAIKEVSPEDFAGLKNGKIENIEDSAASMDPDPPEEAPEPDTADKRSWL